ncbi:MAG: hypothetical protein SPH93_03035 [Clostridium sp.]|nr:hypothetical protein [Clostridium sp.]
MRENIKKNYGNDTYNLIVRKAYKADKDLNWGINNEFDKLCISKM